MQGNIRKARKGSKGGGCKKTGDRSPKISCFSPQKKNNKQIKIMNILENLKQLVYDNPQIEAVFRGINPAEKNQVVYYLLDGNYEYNKALENKIIDLEFKLLDETKESFMIMHWPVFLKDAEDYPFLGKCVYKKD